MTQFQHNEIQKAIQNSHYSSEFCAELSNALQKLYESTQWQPIETAPDQDWVRIHVIKHLASQNDDNPYFFDALDDYKYTVAVRIAGIWHEYWPNGDESSIHINEFTHWKPYPEPPQ